MQRAFNAKFLVSLTRYPKPTGSYNEFNEWVSDTTSPESIKGRLLSGNRFSQFDVGQAAHNEDGGLRISDFRSLYITDKYNLEIGDMIAYKGVYYNTLQKSPESHYGFTAYLLERSEKWVAP